MDLPTKNNRMNKRIKIVKPEEHLIVDPIVIALLEYMLNIAFNPGESLFNKPTWHQHHRDVAAPHFKSDPYAGTTIGNWTQDKVEQHVNNYASLATHAYKIDQIYPGGVHKYRKKGEFALSNSSFRKAQHQLMRKMGVPEFVMNASSNRSNKTKGSGGYYDEFTTIDALKLAFINHCPPLIHSWDVAMTSLPVYPGPLFLQKLRDDVRFLADGSMLPVNLKGMQHPSPQRSLTLPPHEHKIISPENAKTAKAASTVGAYLNPNSEEAHLAQSTTFGIVQDAAAFKQQAIMHQNLQVTLALNTNT